GVPVVIGPMNGGMEYPAGFRYMESQLANQTLKIARLWSNFFNVLIPGKLRATTLLVANSRTRDALPKFIRGQVDKLVENGVDLSLWKQNPQIQSAGLDDTREQHPQQATKFVFIGRLVDWKAVDLLLIASKNVVKQIPIELEIIGTGSELATLQNLAKELDLTENQNVENTESTSQKGDIVSFVGWLSQAECAQRLNSADVLVLPSLFECGGAVILEAMAMGIPVIATNWGGPADYLDESCGILVNPISRDSFINDITGAMLKMAKSPELRQAMGKAGRQRVLENFDWEVKVTKIIDIYQEAIARTKT
uniref:glycosyltransferase family 4 protein n=1 Tax=Calothrix rhizosoleniae TaxID=888997 RepID=UPI001F33C09F